MGEGANESAAGTASDLAGNTAAAKLDGLKVDETKPVVAYTGAQDSYTLTDTVNITCAATDALSGVASTTCANASGPAWQFGAGKTTLAASATDLAGNVGTGSVSFTVVVTPTSLEALIGQLVTDAGVAAGLEAKAAAIASAPNANAKAGKLKAFDNQVDAQVGKSITAEQAALLKQLAAAL